jgi:hypothetical protein
MAAILVRRSGSAPEWMSSLKYENDEATTRATPEYGSGKYDDLQYPPPHQADGHLR